MTTQDLIAAGPQWKQLIQWDFKSFNIYSSDLTHVIFFWFSKLKKRFKGQKFNSDEKVKAEVKRWFNAQTEEVYLDSVSQLVKRWQKCIVVEGSYYVEI